MYIENFLEEWDEDDSAELLDDDIPSFWKPTCPFSSVNYVYHAIRLITPRLRYAS